MHPFALYIKIWILLFILSTCSYLVDFFQVQGYWRWALVLTFMMLKAGLIISVFMHLVWEKIALKVLIILPPLCLFVLISLMAIEAIYTEDSRRTYFSESDAEYEQKQGH